MIVLSVCLSLTFSLYVSPSLSPSCSLSLSLSLSLLHTHKHTHTVSLSLTHTHSLAGYLVGGVDEAILEDAHALVRPVLSVCERESEKECV